MMNLQENFIGSCIEFFCTIMLLNLFDSAYLRKKLYMFFTIPLMAVATVVLEYTNCNIFLQLIVNYSFVVVALVIITRRKVHYVIFEFLFAVVIIIMIEFALVELQETILAKQLSFYDRLLHLFVLLVFCLGINCNDKIVTKFRSFYDQNSKSVHLVTSNVFIGFVSVLYLWNVDTHQLYANIELISFFILLWVLINLYLLKELINDMKNKKAIRNYAEYIDMIENILDELYAEKHEYNKHLQAILQMCDGCRNALDRNCTAMEIKYYILELTDKKNYKQGFCVEAGTGIINGLIYSKMKDAENQGIELQYISSITVSEFPCLKYEMVEILDNLLTNAIEYLNTIDGCMDKKIFIDIGMQDDKVYINIANSMPENELIAIEKFTNKGYSTKQGIKRGYGLYNVKQIISKYGGSIEIFIENNQLNIFILF